MTFTIDRFFGILLSLKGCCLVTEWLAKPDLCMTCCPSMGPKKGKGFSELSVHGTQESQRVKHFTVLKLGSGPRPGLRTHIRQYYGAPWWCSVDTTDGIHLISSKETPNWKGGREGRVERGDKKTWILCFWSYCF